MGGAVHQRVDDGRRHAIGVAPKLHSRLTHRVQLGLEPDGPFLAEAGQVVVLTRSCQLGELSEAVRARAGGELPHYDT